MAGSPMKFFYRQEIERIAYEETVRALRGARGEQLARDFARHDMKFVDPAARPSAPRSSDDGEGRRVVA